MKTITIIRKNPEAPLPSGNPFVVTNSHFSKLVVGVATIVRTGMEIDIPNDCDLNVYESMLDYVSILNVFLDNNKEIILSVIKTNMGTCEYEKNTPIAKLGIIKKEKEHVRFVERQNGKRISYSVNVENPTIEE